MRILIIAPHMDDEVLGCGGTIARHIERGDEVHVCFIANRVYNHKYDLKSNKKEMECALKAREILGYREAYFLNLHDERLDTCIQDIIIPLEKCIKSVDPEIVFINHWGDNHQDHKAVFQAAMVALRPFASQNVKKIICYEVPSSTDQSPPLQAFAFLPNFYVNITSFLEKKLKALACYETESRNFPHPRSLLGVKIHAQKRGLEIGFEAAEAFFILREKLY